MQAQFKAGDRVALVLMGADPEPIPVGSEGVVTYASIVDLGDLPYEQVGVEWDSGRTLGVCCPPDVLRRL